MAMACVISTPVSSKLLLKLVQNWHFVCKFIAGRNDYTANGKAHNSTLNGFIAERRDKNDCILDNGQSFCVRARTEHASVCLDWTFWFFGKTSHRTLNQLYASESSGRETKFGSSHSFWHCFEWRLFLNRLEQAIGWPFHLWVRRDLYDFPDLKMEKRLTSSTV